MVVGWKTPINSQHKSSELVVVGWKTPINSQHKSSELVVGCWLENPNQLTTDNKKMTNDYYERLLLQRT
ncbi:hypothetical protein CBP15_09210 [Fischerella thermalis WC442]|nr:hypothetical protein CBP15_09210 [Fischerella thermalis WC442]